MTTIVYCHKTKMIAYDGFVVSGNEIMDTADRKYIKKGDLLFFTAGGTLDIDEFLKVHAGGEPTLTHFNMSMILIKKNIAYKCGFCKDKKMVWEEELKRNYDIGSGGSYARGALDAGADVKKAVKIAANIDINTGGKIRTYNILTGKHA